MHQSPALFIKGISRPREDVGELDRDPNELMFVTHALCSAAAVAYNSGTSRASEWEMVSRLLLEAAYEATFYAALEAYQRHGGGDGGGVAPGCGKLYLTFLGGGVFGNASRWIHDAIRKSVAKFRGAPLEVFMVVYGDTVPSDMRRFEAEMRGEICRGGGTSPQ